MNALVQVSTMMAAAALGLLAMRPDTVHAQTDEAILLQIEASENETLVNGVIVAQQGASNEAYIRQVTGSNTSGAETLQLGDHNRIRLVQVGPYLDIKIAQEGSDNFYEGDIEGEDARIDISQNGTANIIFQSLYVNGSDISIRQNGNENEVVHSGTSSGSGLQIQQQGSAMKLIIQTY